MNEIRRETQIPLTPEVSEFIGTLDLTHEDRLILESEAVYPAIRHDLDRLMEIRNTGAITEAKVLLEAVKSYIQIIKQGNQEI